MALPLSKLAKTIMFFGGGAPSAPTNVVATGTSTNIRLTWSVVPGTVYYKIYRGLHGGARSFLITAGINSYTDNTAVVDNRYDYHVTAVNGMGESSASSVVTSYIVIRTGTLLQTFYGQAAESWTEALALTTQTLDGTDYFTVGGCCDYTGNYTGGVDTFTGTNFDWIFSRYTLAGQLDTTAGTYGTWRWDFGADDDELYSAVRQPDNKIVVCGISYNSGANQQTIYLLRFNPDFSLDLEFGTLGVVTLYPNNNYRHQVAQVALQSTGKIIVCTEQIAAPGNSSIRINRLHKNGALDKSFSSSGTNYTFILQPNSRDTTGTGYCGKILIDSNDKIIVASYHHDLNGDGSEYVGLVARVLADGSATDSSFGTNMGGGVYCAVLHFANLDGYINGLTATSSGYMVCGAARINASTMAGYVAVLNSDGTLNTSFSGDGKLEANYGTLTSTYFLQCLLSTDGTFHQYGLSSSLNETFANSVSPTTKYLGVGLTAAGGVDTSFGTSGTYEQSGYNMALFFDLFQTSGGEIYLGGHQAYPPSSGIAQASIVKLTEDAALDTFFGDLISPSSAPTAPTVVTGSASSITTTSATIAGTVNPNSTSTTYHVEYGLDSNYGQRTSDITVGSQSSAQSVSTSISSLLPGKTYHYRLAAYNGSIGCGSDSTFTTSSGFYTVLNDPFTDTNGVTLPNHTGYATTDLTGSAYLELQGLGTIQSNKAHFDSDPVYGVGNKTWCVVHPVNTRDGTVTGVVTWNGGTEGHNLIEGLLFNCKNINIWIAVGFTYFGGGTLAIMQNDNGSVTLLDSIAMTPVSGTAYTMSLTILSGSCTATVSGGSRTLTGTMTGSSFDSTSTNAGWFLCKGLGDTVDDFQVSAYA